MRNTFSLALICVAVLIPLFQEGFSLRCHVCYSTKSWDDCVKNSRNHTCHLEGVDDSSWACQTAHTSRLGKNNQQFDTFYKSCVILEMCNEERCRRGFVKQKDLNTTKASYCELECCFRDGCNDTLSGASSTKSIADWLSSSNDMTMETIAPRSSISRASSTKSIADWLSSSNDMTMKTIAPRSSLSGARSTKSIADWPSSSFVYMMVFAVWSSIAQ